MLLKTRLVVACDSLAVSLDSSYKEDFLATCPAWEGALDRDTSSFFVDYG